MILYQITCIPTKKIYIGVTMYGMQRRWRQHWLNAHRAPHSPYPMYVDMRSHAEGLWVIVQIGTAETYAGLLDLEREAVARLRSSDPSIGYNRTAGGQGIPGLRFKKTPEQIERSARHHRGKKLPPERVEKLKIQLAKMRQAPRDYSEHHRRDDAIMAFHYSSPSVAATGAAFGIKESATCIALRRCRTHLLDMLMATSPIYRGVTLPWRIHPDHLEVK